MGTNEPRRVSCCPECFCSCHPFKPIITPEIAERLDREGKELAAEYRKRVLKMWDVKR